MPTPVPPLPTIQKTWQFQNNINVGFNGTDFLDTAKMILAIKDALKSFAQHPWTVVGSSDGTTGAMDNVDRLTDTTKMVYGGGNHSWIVLQQSQVNANMQVLFDFPTDLHINGQLAIYWSPVAGFTGGAANARPTAIDEQQPWQGNNFIFFNNLNFTGAGLSQRAHVHMSTDGECTRIFWAHNHQVKSFLLFDKPAAPVTGWTNPAIAIMTNTNGVPLYLGSWFNTLINGNGPLGAMPMFSTAFYTNQFSETTNLTWPLFSEWDNHFQMTGVGMFSNNVGQRGRHGHIYDIWSLPQIAQTGYSIPLSGSKEFIVTGQFAFPWDGGNIEMA